VHKPALDEMGIALYHESIPRRTDASAREPHQPGREPHRSGPRSTTGRPGMRGGWRPKGR
jgi:hypothetical protein